MEKTVGNEEKGRLKKSVWPVRWRDSDNLARSLHDCHKYRDRPIVLLIVFSTALLLLTAFIIPSP